MKRFSTHLAGSLAHGRGISVERLPRRIATAVILSTAAWAGCSNQSEPSVESAVSAEEHAYDLRVPKSYPDIESLYTSDFGIYRGCGPNNAVCHNSREFPNLATMGSLLESIGLPCNQ